MEKGLLTPKEVAAYIGMNVGSLYHWVAARRIPHIKIGKLLRFNKAAIDEWLQANAVKEKETERW